MKSKTKKNVVENCRIPGRAGRGRQRGFYLPTRLISDRVVSRQHLADCSLIYGPQIWCTLPIFNYKLTRLLLIGHGRDLLPVLALKFRSRLAPSTLAIVFPLQLMRTLCTWCHLYCPSSIFIYRPRFVVKSQTGYAMLMSFRHKIITISKVNCHRSALITFTFGAQRLIYNRYQITNHHYYCFVCHFSLFIQDQFFSLT